MRQVMIRCPISGELVFAGLEVSDLEHLDRTGYLLIDCLECGQDHAWEPSQAVLAGATLVSSSQWAW